MGAEQHAISLETVATGGNGAHTEPTLPELQSEEKAATGNGGPQNSPLSRQPYNQANWAGQKQPEFGPHRRGPSHS